MTGPIKPLTAEEVIQPRLVYHRGATLKFIDLGIYDGVKIELSHERESELAIVLQSDEVEEIASWMYRSMGQKGDIIKFQKGDKTVLRKAAVAVKYKADI